MKSTDDIIRQIKDGTLREDASVELKGWLPNKDMLAKVLVGLANAGGGHLIIGIKESADGCKAVGLREGEGVAIRMIESVCNEFSIHINTNIKKINISISSHSQDAISSLCFRSNAKPTNMRRKYASS